MLCKKSNDAIGDVNILSILHLLLNYVFVWCSFG